MKSQLKLPHQNPVRPADWEIADAAAIQALSRGDASPDQQRRALAFITFEIAGKEDLSFRPGNQYDTAFAEGKRFVALQISKFVNLNLAAIRQAKEK